MRTRPRLLEAAWHVAFRPRALTRRLLDAGRVLPTGLGAFAVLAVAYTFTVAWGFGQGFGAAVDPWIPIPAEDYYFWEMFFAAPVYLVVLVAYAGVVQLVARALGGTGTYEDVVGLLGLSMVLPTFLLMWLPETLLMVAFPGARATELGGFAGLPTWADVARQLAVPLWMVWIGTEAVSECHALSAGRTLVAVLLGLLPAALLAVTWIR